jgi:hypothetical protein
MASTDLGNVPLIDPSQLGKAATADQAFQSIDQMLNGILTINANTATSPYTLPFSTGDEPAAVKYAIRAAAYYITGSPGAPWIGYMPASVQRGNFVFQNNMTDGSSATLMVEGQTGVTITPGEAALCFLNGTDVVQPPIILATGTQPWEVGNFVDGLPGNGVVVMRFVVARTITFPANFSLNQLKVGTNPASTASWAINKNGSSVGSASTSTSGVTTWTSSGGSPVVFNTGDVCTFVAPSPQDASLANPTWIFSGTR